MFDENDIRPNPSKFDAVKDFPTPIDVTSLCSFLDLTSFYHRFVPSFSQIAFPMHLLLKKNAKCLLTEDQQKSFFLIKTALINAPTFAHDNETYRLILKTGLSKQGLGGILHIVRNGTERPVTCISRRTTPAEANYHSNELECLVFVIGASYRGAADGRAIER